MEEEHNNKKKKENKVVDYVKKTKRGG